MGMLILEASTPHGRGLAMKAGENRGIAVGWDEEFSSATFDADIDDDELEQVVFEELADLDPDWRTHLRAVD